MKSFHFRGENRLNSTFKKSLTSRTLAVGCAPDPGNETVWACPTPGYIHTAREDASTGRAIGVISRSGTLTYEAVWQLTSRDIGQTTCVGIGGDPVPGTNFIDCLSEFQNDPETHAIMMLGEIGGSAEEEAAEYIAANVTKPMSAYIAGVTAPAGKKMGHAGAIVSGNKGTAQGKMDALAAAGVKVGLNPTEAGELMAEIVAAL